MEDTEIPIKSENSEQPPPIVYSADFYSNHDELLEDIRENTLWDERMKVRKTASFGVPYDYGSLKYDISPAMPPSLEIICDRILDRFGFRPNNCLLNYYSDGNSTIGFHSDSAQNLEPGTGVVIVSLGCIRTIVFREKANRLNNHPLDLNPGSLLFMSTEMQEKWLHGIPKSLEPTGNRISLTFRLVNRRL